MTAFFGLGGTMGCYADGGEHGGEERLRGAERGEQWKGWERERGG